MSNSSLRGFVHIICNIFFKVIFFNLVFKLLTKCCEQFQCYPIGSWKIYAIEFLITTCLSDIINNSVWLPTTYQWSKSKNQLQLLFISFLTIVKHNGNFWFPSKSPFSFKKWKATKNEKKILANWKEQTEEGFKCMGVPSCNFGQDWEPNYIQLQKIIQIQGKIKWLLDKFEKELSLRI